VRGGGESPGGEEEVLRWSLLRGAKAWAMKDARETGGYGGGYRGGDCGVGLFQLKLNRWGKDIRFPMKHPTLRQKAIPKNQGLDRHGGRGKRGISRRGG